MPSQFFGLNIAHSGLMAANAALNTTGNNIANAQTRGYSRQQAVQRANDALRTFATYGCAGAGVDTIAIERMRDEFNDVRYWNNNTLLGEYDTKNYYMRQIENYYIDDPKTSSVGFNTIFNNMYKALEEFKNGAGIPEKASQFVSTAKSLTEYFNSLAANLQKVQKDANEEVKLQVDRINTLAAEIAILNSQISTVELSGTTANELRDQRTVLLDELSSIVPIETSEKPMHGSGEASSTTRFIVKIAGGQLLVDSKDYKTLKCVEREVGKKVNQTDAEGLFDIQWSDGSSFGMYGKNLGGKLEGLLSLRDGNNAHNFNGTVGGIGTDANGRQTVTVNVTSDLLKDLNKSNLSAGGILNLNGQNYTYDSWSFTDDGAGNCSYTFTMSNSNQGGIQNHVINGPAQIGTSIDYKGIPYYMSQMNEWARDFALEFNKILNQPGAVDMNGEPHAGNLFTGNQVNGTQFQFTTTYDRDPVTGAYTVSSSDDSYYRLTAMNLNISTIIEGNPDKMATHTVASDGTSKYDILDQLVKLRDDKNTMSFRGGSAQSFLECMYSDVALSTKSAMMFSNNHKNIGDFIQNQRLSVSGVDEDEEALNLVKFQNSYTLASKMIQTLTEIYDRLILQTGV